MNELQIFNNSEFGEIRTISINNEPWFVGKDITDKLEYQNGSRDISRHVDEEDMQVISIPNDKQSRNMLVINESGLYALILGSKLPKAKQFKHWVTSEVLPTIRKQGGYNLPTTYKQALQQLLIEVEKRELLELENKEMKPKADFFDAVADSKSAIPMNEVAKVLGVRGYGRNNLFEFLREQGILDRNNIPYQRYVDNGWFRVIEQAYTKNGEKHINFKTLVYQKGVDGIRKRLLKGE
jgi:prophage antirepressor-like protein